MNYHLVKVLCLTVLFSSFNVCAGQEIVEHNENNPGQNSHFNGHISRDVLDFYLSHAVTHAGLLSSYSDPTTKCRKDDIRMLTSIGAKFIGRAAFAWHLPPDEQAHFEEVRKAASMVHEADPDIILQAAVFEVVTTDVNNLPVPSWVFEAFDIKPVKRNFNYSAMLYDDNRYLNHFGTGNSVPDMSKLETKMWFYYRAKRYIDSGCEAIHFGQVHLMDKNDPDHTNWADLLGRVRKYASQHARRNLVLCDAHTHGVVLDDGRLLFDFHSYPCRRTGPEGILGKGYKPIYRNSKGGITPSGWKCTHAPYLLELDNWASVNDEITWFAKKDESFRNLWLRFAWNWGRAHDPNGWFQMPTRRILATKVNNTRMYHANRKSTDCPFGFNQEETIKQIWDDNR